MRVIEDVAAMSQEQPLRSVVRGEHLLLSPPHEPNMPIKLWRDHPLLPVAHFPEHGAQPVGGSGVEPAARRVPALPEEDRAGARRAGNRRTR